MVAYAERVDRNFSLDIILKGDIRGNCDVAKIKICEIMGFVGILRNDKVKKPSFQQSVCWCKLVRRYVPMTPYKSFENWLGSRLGSQTLRSNLISQGFLRSHQNIMVLISTHQFAPIGSFSILFYLDMPTYPIIL